MTSILIADDHSIVRAGLRNILSGVPGVNVTDEACDANEVMNKIRTKDYSVIVLDIALPGKSGLDVLKEIKSAYPGLPVLMLSMHPESHYAIRCLKSGAAGYVAKDKAAEELVSAVLTVASGRKYVSAALSEKLACNLGSDTARELYETLSDREYEILCMIAAGRTIGEIAEQQFLSVKTVSTYRSRILDKLNLKNNAELTNYAIKNNLIF